MAGEEEAGTLNAILHTLQDILYYTRPPVHPLFTPKYIKYDNSWTSVAKLRSDTQLWVLHNTSSDETVLIAFTNNPDDNAWIPLYPEQSISRGTRPDYILAKREDGNTGTPYPILLLEEWQGEELKTYRGREKSTLGKIGKRGR